MAVAHGYVTVKPTFDAEGNVTQLKLDTVTQKFPTLTAGAVALQLEVEIPDEVFRPAKIRIFVDEDHIIAGKPVSVYVVSDED